MNKRREYGEKEHVFTKIKGRTNNSERQATFYHNHVLSLPTIPDTGSFFSQIICKLSA